MVLQRVVSNLYMLQAPDSLQTAPCLKDLQGRVAIVTGASAGIGKACAVALAAAGMKVVACARRKAKLEEFKSAAIAEGAKEDFLLTAQCDVQSEGDIKAVIATVEVRSLAHLKVHLIPGHVTLTCMCSRTAAAGLHEDNSTLSHS
jgi:NADPH:quinone reductase-like Zn-dependent oxidoreductase